MNSRLTFRQDCKDSKDNAVLKKCSEDCQCALGKGDQVCRDRCYFHCI